MHCAICDADSDTVVMEHGEFSPCADCQAVIYDCLQGYPDINDPDTADEIVLEDFDNLEEEPDYVFGEADEI